MLTIAKVCLKGVRFGFRVNQVLVEENHDSSISGVFRMVEPLLVT
jgi:hypothetical protein